MENSIAHKRREASKSKGDPESAVEAHVHNVGEDLSFPGLSVICRVRLPLVERGWAAEKAGKEWAQATKKSVTAVQEDFSLLVSRARMMLETFSLSWLEQRDLWRFGLYPLHSNTRAFSKGKG